MRYRIQILLALAMLYSAQSWACGSVEHPTTFMTREDGTKLGLFLPHERIRETEAWDPSQGEPPLSVSEAYAAVMAWVPGKYSRYDDVAIGEISLTHYGCSLVSNRWYYVFDLVPEIEGNRLYGGGNWVAVLMDGFVVGTREY